MAGGAGGGIKMITASAPKHLMMMMGTGLVIINLLLVVDIIPFTSGEAGAGAGAGVYDHRELASPPPPADKGLTFKVDDEDDWDENYQNLIGNVTERVRSNDPEWEERLGVPVLPPQPPEGQMPTAPWLDVVLQHGRTSVTVRIRGDNLYVVGFQRATDNDQWWEFNRDHQDKKKPPPPPFISGSKPLGYSCNYNHLSGVAGQSTDEVSLGRYPLSDAVKQLATVPRPDQDHQRTARSLLIVIIMVSEASRYPEIAELFIHNFDYNIHLNERMDVLIRSWGDISERVFRAFDHRVPNNPPNVALPFPLSLGQGLINILTREDALLIIGIVLSFRNCISKHPRILVLLPVAEYSVQQGHCAEGRPLLEVISVVINNIDGEDPGQLYGTIIVTDALGFQFIYDRAGPDNYEDVSPGKAATLTGPADRAISAVGAVTIKLDLWDRDILSPDDQVSNGTVEWDHFAFAERYDVPLSQTVKGMYGSATVNYVVFGDAVEAKFEVTLVKGYYDEKQDYVYGNIVALIGDLDIETVLLSTTISDYSHVWYGNRIPLQKKTVAMPLSSYVRVSALLTNYHSYEIAGGCTYLGAKSSGTTKWRIAGQYGEIEIKITWNPSY